MKALDPDKDPRENLCDQKSEKRPLSEVTESWWTEKACRLQVLRVIMETLPWAGMMWVDDTAYMRHSQLQNVLHVTGIPL